MEIKGIIELGDNIDLTCCTSLEDLKIGGVSLYSLLGNFFNQSEAEYWEDYKKESPKYSMRYVILDEEPKEMISFESLSAKVVTEMLYCDHISGCYSEWTCGYGGFDYVTGDDGHSIFTELKSYLGKYVYLKL
jgi:hypothetical protein